MNFNSFVYWYLYSLVKFVPQIFFILKLFYQVDGRNIFRFLYQLNTIQHPQALSNYKTFILTFDIRIF